ncbi:glycosyltransferase family 4 protein [Rectinema subterraneum]|jgi:glycosyltransferase involved in cell wall biosynthesis|uniref:glycosyltransferase family 4 protein n=1 Tax=Rectinema subterraneum TaxID=2653714 RepID=UPI00131BD8F9|nr:glycosyltransferase family 4 protein [Rectinema subterraneum]
MKNSFNKNILMITRYYYPHCGGNENQAKLLAEYLSKYTNANIRIITSHYSKKLPKNQNINNVNVDRLSCIEIKNINKFPKIIRNILFLIQEYSFIIAIYIYLKKNIKYYDIVHVHQSSWLCLIPTYFAKANNIPIIIKESTLNGFQYLKYLLLPQKIKYYVIKKAEFIAISTMIERNLIEQGVIKEKISLIPNAIEINKFRKFRKCYNGLDNNDNIILYVGNYKQGNIKGLDILLKAVAIVKNKYPNIKLRIIGDGNINSYKDIIIKENLNEIIENLGQQNDISKFFLDVKIFVLPSRSEGMSNSLLEAMAAGIPCVATRVSGVEDIIKDSENGFIVEKEDYMAIAERIIDILKDKRLSKKFYIESAYISKKFDISIIADKYINLYGKFKN